MWDYDEDDARNFCVRHHVLEELFYELALEWISAFPVYWGYFKIKIYISIKLKKLDNLPN